MAEVPPQPLQMSQDAPSFYDTARCQNCQQWVESEETCLNKQFPKGKKTSSTSYCSYFTQKKGRLKLSYAFVALNDYQENVESYQKQQPFFFDRTGQFWFWDYYTRSYHEVDETDLLTAFDEAYTLRGLTIESRTRNGYLEAFKRVGRGKQPKEPTTQWVQFRTGMYDLNTGQLHPASPEYFSANPIPWDIATDSSTPVMDKLITEWVGEKYLQTVYEIIAYSCFRAYPIQVLFCFYGSGRNGKTCLLRLIDHFLGSMNVCCTDLDLIAGDNRSRFETMKLYKKLCCQMGETNFSVLRSSSLIKRLTGGDLIGFERKGKMPFDGQNYAKIIIASNSLPSSMDTSEGYYRRWVILPFPNEFPEGKDVLQDIPEREYEALARKVVEILPGLLARGSFSNQGSVEERKMRYIMASNPLPVFIKNFCVESEEAYVKYTELRGAYTAFLKAKKMRKVGLKEFRSALEDEGHWVERANKMGEDGFLVNTSWVEGLGLVAGWKERVEKWAEWAENIKIPTQLSIAESKWENQCKVPILPRNPAETPQSCRPEVWHKCFRCGKSPCVDFVEGQPVCDLCWIDMMKKGEKGENEPV